MLLTPSLLFLLLLQLLLLLVDLLLLLVQLLLQLAAAPSARRAGCLPLRRWGWCEELV